MNVLIALALLVPALAQEAPAKPVPPALKDPFTVGGIRWKGRVEQECMLARSGGGMFQDFSGDFSAITRSDGTLALRAGAHEERYELYRKDGRIIQRQTWMKGQVKTDLFAREVPILLDLKRFHLILGSSKRLTVLEPKKVEGESCLCLGMSLPVDCFNAGAPAGNMAELEGIDATIAVGQDSGILREMVLRFNRRLRVSMGGVPEEDEKGRTTDLYRWVTTYQFTAVEMDKDVVPDFPVDIKRCFVE